MKKIENPQNVTNAPIIILVRPQLDENMGMVARAMMNCALYELRLVSPRDNHLSEKAVSASSGAQVILENAKIYETLSDAIADCHFVYATTARPRDMTKPVYAPHDAVPLVNTAVGRNQKVAFLFGAERTGLENSELICANGIIEIPLNPLHSSLNLSQAVLLVGYEWYKSVCSVANTRYETGDSEIAEKQEVDAFLKRLETELGLRGYFRFPDKVERMQHNLRNIFTRMPLGHSEVKTLHGVLNDLIRPLTNKK